MGIDSGELNSLLRGDFRPSLSKRILDVRFCYILLHLNRLRERYPEMFEKELNRIRKLYGGGDTNRPHPQRGYHAVW